MTKGLRRGRGTRRSLLRGRGENWSRVSEVEPSELGGAVGTPHGRTSEEGVAEGLGDEEEMIWLWWTIWGSD